jgi:phosphoserine phosphatase RsbU/P
MVKILVIDDDATMRLLVTLVLRKQGYEVIQAKNGEEGLALAHEIIPALIICDWMMPKLDGLQVCQAIKSDPKFSATFFILLTAREEVADRIQGLDTGADEFLSKPIESTELQSRVRAGLRLYQLNQKLQRLAADLQQQKQLLEAELAEAAAYVQSLLPTPEESKIPIRSYFLPSTELGGDFFYYDWIRTADQPLLRFYFLDVSGHGLRAALLSVSIRNFLQLSSLQERNINLENPGAVLNLLNDNFSMEAHGGQYFTIFYGTYNPKTRELTYANGGHPPGILVSPAIVDQNPGQYSRENSTDIPLHSNSHHSSTSETNPAQNSPLCLEATGIPVGFMPGFKFDMKSQVIPQSSKLYVFSDGIYEMVDSSTGKPWGLKKFTAMLETFSHSPSVELEDLIENIRQETGIQTFDDDCAIIEFNFSHPE